MSKLKLGYLRNLNINDCCRCFSRFISKETTAGIIVIGDEILKGEVIDTNSHFMTERLHQWGVKLKKITVVGDNIDDVSEDVYSFSQNYDYVLTTGGIGPTHDDITFEAIAKAFNEKVILHPELVQLCEKYYKTNDLDSPGMKLAHVPESAKLNFAKEHNIKLLYPNVSVQNVYIFPGIPQLFERLFNLVGPELFQSSCKFYTRCIYFNVSEDKIAPLLDNLTKGFPHIVVGSYPQLLNRDYKVKVTIESKLLDSTIKAHDQLLKAVPKDWIVQLNGK